MIRTLSSSPTLNTFLAKRGALYRRQTSTLGFNHPSDLLFPGASWNGTAGSGGTAPTATPAPVGSSTWPLVTGNFDIPLIMYLTASQQVTVVADTEDAAFIDHVDFWWEGRTRTQSAQTISSRTGAIGYACTLDFKHCQQDGDSLLYATIFPVNGTPRRVGPIQITIVGTGVSPITRPRRYLDAVNGNDAWDGTTRAFVSGTTGPVKTVRQACVNFASIGARCIMASGTYREDLNTGTTVLNTRPITFEPASGVLGDVIIDRTSRYVNNLFRWQPLAQNIIFEKIQVETSNIVQIAPANTAKIVFSDSLLADTRNGPTGPTFGYYVGQPPGQSGVDFQSDYLKTSSGPYWALVNTPWTHSECNAVGLLVNSTITTGCDNLQLQAAPSFGVTYINFASDKRGNVYIRYHSETPLTIAAVGMTGLMSATSGSSGTFDATFTFAGHTYTTATKINWNDSPATIQSKLLAATRSGGTTFTADGGGASCYGAATLNVGPITVIWSAGAASAPGVANNTVVGATPTFTAPGRCALQWTGGTTDSGLAPGQSDPTLRVRILTGAITGQGSQAGGLTYVGGEQAGYSLYQHDSANHVTTLQSAMPDLYAAGARANDTAWVAGILHPDGIQLGQRTTGGANYDNVICQRWNQTGDFVQPMFLQPAAFTGAGTVTTNGAGDLTCSTTHGLQVNDFVWLSRTTNPQFRQARRVIAIVDATHATLVSDFTAPQTGETWAQGKSMNNSAFQLVAWHEDYSYGTGGPTLSQTTDVTQWQHGFSNVVLRQVSHMRTQFDFRSGNTGFGLERILLRDSIFEWMLSDAVPGFPTTGLTIDTNHFNQGTAQGINHELGATTFDARLKPLTGVALTCTPKLHWNVYGEPLKLDGTALVGAV